MHHRYASPLYLNFTGTLNQTRCKAQHNGGNSPIPRIHWPIPSLFQHFLHHTFHKKVLLDINNKMSSNLFLAVA